MAAAIIKYEIMKDPAVQAKLAEFIADAAPKPPPQKKWY